MSSIEIEGKTLQLTNLDKLMYPDIGVTKADVIDYYIRMAKYILPYLKNRPFTMLPYPDGVTGKSFYQKQCPDEAPDWLQTVTLPSENKDIDWCLVNDLPSLIFMANRACLETHAWFSRLPNLDSPDIAVFDLDPSGDTGFRDAVKAAKLIHMILDEYHITAVPKTSGATGIHVVIPIEPAPFEDVRSFLLSVCRIVEKTAPDLFTTERTISKRGNRIYLDAVQNSRAKTIPSPYSLRATPKATVSAPLLWDEVEFCTPDMFTMKNIEARIAKMGDLFAPVYTLRQKLPLAVTV